MPVLALSTFSLYPALSLSEAIRFALDEGWEGIEVWMTPQVSTPSHWDPEKLDPGRLRSLVRSGGLRLTVHSPGGVNNLATHDAWHRRAAGEAIKGAIDLAAEIEAVGVVVHPGTVEATATFATYPRLTASLNFEGLRQEALRHSAEAIAGLVRYGRSKGVAIYIENVGYEKGTITPAPEDLLDLLRRVGVDGVSLAYDTGHAALSWGVPEGVRPLADHVAHVHLNDSPGDNVRRGVRNHHVELGQGAIDFGAIAGFLRGVAGSLVLEVVDHEDPLGAVRRSREFLSALLWGGEAREERRVT